MSLICAVGFFIVEGVVMFLSFKWKVVKVPLDSVEQTGGRSQLWLEAQGNIRIGSNYKINAHTEARLMRGKIVR